MKDEVNDNSSEQRLLVESVTSYFMINSVERSIPKNTLESGLLNKTTVLFSS